MFIKYGDRVPAIDITFLPDTINSFTKNWCDISKAWSHSKWKYIVDGIERGLSYHLFIVISFFRLFFCSHRKLFYKIILILHITFSFFCTLVWNWIMKPFDAVFLEGTKLLYKIWPTKLFFVRRSSYHLKVAM